MSETANVKISNTTFSDQCRGFAAMIRSGAMTPEDQEMVAAKFSEAADLIDSLTRLAFPEAYP